MASHWVREVRRFGLVIIALILAPLSGRAAEISILAATYGGNCRAPMGNVTTTLQTSCNGKLHCSYVVDYRRLGDPARGCKKDFTLSYMCAPRNDPRKLSIPGEAGIGGTAELDCADIDLTEAANASAQRSGKVPFTTKSVSLRECSDTNCALWMFNGSHGEGRWTNGEVAALSVEQHGDGMIVIQGSISNGADAGVTLLYVGYREGNKIVRGTFTALTPAGDRVSDEWSADIDVATIEEANDHERAAISKHDDFELLRWFLVGVADGDAGSQRAAGNQFASGRGLPQDYAKAVELYRASAEQGDARAALNLATMYERGLGVQKDAAQQAAWLKKAGPDAVKAMQEARARQQQAPPACTAESVAEVNRGHLGALNCGGGLLDWMQAVSRAEQKRCAKDPVVCEEEERRAAQWEQARQDNEDRLRREEQQRIFSTGQ